MPDLSKYTGLITICTAEEWEDQKECILEGVEKSAYRDCCMWLMLDGEVCTNPDAVKSSSAAPIAVGGKVG